MSARGILLLCSKWNHNLKMEKNSFLVTNNTFSKFSLLIFFYDCM